jgi:hypothetical protein
MQVSEAASVCVCWLQRRGGLGRLLTHHMVTNGSICAHVFLLLPTAPAANSLHCKRLMPHHHKLGTAHLLHSTCQHLQLCGLNVEHPCQTRCVHTKMCTTCAGSRHGRLNEQAPELVMGRPPPTPLADCQRGPTGCCHCLAAGYQGILCPGLVPGNWEQTCLLNTPHAACQNAHEDLFVSSVVTWHGMRCTAPHPCLPQARFVQCCSSGHCFGSVDNAMTRTAHVAMDIHLAKPHEWPRRNLADHLCAFALLPRLLSLLLPLPRAPGCVQLRPDPC